MKRKRDAKHSLSFEEAMAQKKSEKQATPKKRARRRKISDKILHLEPLTEGSLTLQDNRLTSTPKGFGKNITLDKVFFSIATPEFIDSVIEENKDLAEQGLLPRVFAKDDPSKMHSRIVAYWAQRIAITGNPKKSLSENFPMKDSVNENCLGINDFEKMLVHLNIGFKSAKILNKTFTNCMNVGRVITLDEKHKPNEGE